MRAFRSAFPLACVGLCWYPFAFGLSHLPRVSHFSKHNARPVFPLQIGFAVSLSFGLLFAFLYLARFAGFRLSFVSGIHAFAGLPLRPFAVFPCSFRVPPLGGGGLRSSYPFLGGFYCVRRVSCVPSLPCPVFCRFFCAVFPIQGTRAGRGGIPSKTAAKLPLFGVRMIFE